MILYPDLLPRLYRVQEDALRVVGYKIRVTDSFRSYADQEARYAQGRTREGKIVTNAKPGLSFHQFGLAMDCCFMGPDPYLEGLAQSNKDRAETAWKKFGELAKAYGFSWGGDWKTLIDRPHIELSYGLSIHDVLELYRHGGVIGIWKYIDQMRGVMTEKAWPDLTGL